MKIERENRRLEVLFQDLCQGDTFEIDGSLYMVTDERDEEGDLRVVNLENGVIEGWGKNVAVTPVAAKVVIED